MRKMNTFNIGDKVRVAYDRTYFTTTGIDMVITDITHEDVDGEIVTFYRTNHMCPVHGGYNEFELVLLTA